ncbi:MAG: carboxypeptidase regulatory-like domain-containing protein [Bacteroidales bacterium]|jgi:hypothetical protein|nr:carboxypeptidase regulatory-like domain-containing protein [Bacteroidales bacterium]
MKKIIIATVLCLLIGNTLYAQSVIKGQVKDSVDNPIPYLQIVLKQDNKVVNGAYTDDQGQYQIFGIATGTYDIVIGGTMCQNVHTIKEIHISGSEVKFIDITVTCTEVIYEDHTPPLTSRELENIIPINSGFSTERDYNFRYGFKYAETEENKLIITESLSVRFRKNVFIRDGVYYTIDGSEPTEKSEKYDGSKFIQIQDEPQKEDNEVILKALYIAKDGTKGPVREFKFKLASRKTVDVFIAKMDSIYPAEQKALNDLVIEISETSKTEFEKVKNAYDGVWAYFEKYKYTDVICPCPIWKNEMYYVDLPIFDDGRLKKTWWCGGGLFEGKVVLHEAMLQEVLNRLGIENMFIIGDHPQQPGLGFYTVWNVVKLNDEWYNLCFRLEEPDSRNYRGFLISDELMQKYGYMRYDDDEIRERDLRSNLGIYGSNLSPVCPKNYDISEMTKPLSK